MCLSIAPIVLEVVNVICVARPVDLHRLEELAELAVAWLSIHAQDITEAHRTSAQITYTYRNHVQNSAELGVFFPNIEPWSENLIHIKAFR